MQKKIIIVGGGGLGRIVHDVLVNDLLFAKEYQITGFLDTRSDLVLPAELSGQILGSPLHYEPKSDEVFMMAVGDPNWRRQLVMPLAAKNAVFISYTREAFIAGRSHIGPGSFVTPGAIISTDCSIGAYAYIDTNVILGHDVHIGDYCMLGAMSFLAGNVQVGNGVAIHPRATIGKGVRIGDGATIGLGSVVIKDVAANTTVFGNPARTIYL